MSTINYPTSKMSKYVDYHLEPLVKTIPSYGKDTNNFLDKMKDIDKVPEEMYPVTVDGYTNIGNSESIAAAKRALNKQTNKTVATKVITTFLPPILTLNNFIFNCKNYLQIKGYPMGTICAPSYTNIFMAELKRNMYIHLLTTCLCFTCDTLMITL